MNILYSGSRRSVRNTRLPFSPCWHWTSKPGTIYVRTILCEKVDNERLFIALPNLYNIIILTSKVFHIREPHRVACLLFLCIFRDSGYS